MSLYLCKLAKGALVPLQVKLVKDGEDNPIHALHVHETHHRSGAPAHFHKAVFDHIGCPEFAPEGLRILEKRQQLGEIPEQLGHELRARVPPPLCERLGVALRLGPARSLIDRLGLSLVGGVVPPPQRPQQIAELVDPAALMCRAGIDRLQRRRQPDAAIGHDQLELASFQAAPIEIV